MEVYREFQIAWNSHIKVCLSYNWNTPNEKFQDRSPEWRLFGNNLKGRMGKICFQLFAQILSKTNA